MKKRASKPQFVMCVDNDGYHPDLELKKIYRAIPDADAERHREVRVIDESGEDYVFPAMRFVSVEIPRQAEKKRATKLFATAS
jgi:hypothetical protein